ncbi:hypothetical protein BDM02DRAFT_888015 [Thelephora ganbajun]|uniref:Uncharacterized protein n=1 Tax=Thelephora ganbajun TaxID=370292 RepID=A0ACB6Z4Z6_THEGA|nr:hypothetical protein BDM02DRAFT_888015 [Thelephora ganbajun]
MIGSALSLDYAGFEEVPQPSEPDIPQTSKPTRLSTGWRLDPPSNPSRTSTTVIPVSRTEFNAMPSEKGKVRTINDLHPEILFAIFDFATAPPDPTIHNFNRVVSLTHVSPRWMKILLDNGRIWSNVHIRGQDLDMLDTQIKRCRLAPLLVSVKVLPLSTINSDHQTNIQAATKLIRERRDQVTRLEVHMDCTTFQQQLGFEWINLKEFVWVDECPSGSRIHGASYVDPPNGRLPRLKNLSIQKGVN